MHALNDIRFANDILIQNLEGIATVDAWAEKVGFSNTEEFIIKYRIYHNMSPEKTLSDIKVDFAKELLIYYHLPALEVARRIGQKDEKSLNRFLKLHTGKTHIHLVRQYLGGKIA